MSLSLYMAVVVVVVVVVVVMVVVDVCSPGRHGPDERVVLIGLCSQLQKVPSREWLYTINFIYFQIPTWCNG